MTNAPPHQVLSTWLDDQHGPARLSDRQRKLVAGLEETEYVSTSPTNNHDQLAYLSANVSNSNNINNNLITKMLIPEWKSNDIINMFHEERQKIVERGNECKALLENTESVLKEIQALKDSYLYVSPRTSQLHSECKNIIQERNDLRESFEQINTTLNKQEELKSIFRRMPDIKNQILSILNAVCKGYLNGNNLEGTSLDEYYGRFFIECRRIKELTSQLESCLSTSNADELLLHLEEIYTLYFDIREQLIEPMLTKNLTTLISKANRNYCDLLRQTSTSFVRILRNEIQLFNQIFPSPSNQSLLPIISAMDSEQKMTNEYPIKRQAMNNFLELLCKIFYEHLRPVVIHVNHLETLTELYKLVVETMRPEVSEEPYQITMSSLAEDIQERMVFRTEVFIQESVLDYKPSGGDLAYPEKLEIVTGGELKDFQSMWYPTVQRTVLALFYLNRVFDKLTFRELAQEVVLACFKSLDVAQRLVDDRHGGTKIEATLFLSKHLAIIRDQLQSYGIDRVQFQAHQSKTDPSTSTLLEIDASNLESMLKLFQDNEFNASSSDSLWSQLNETIVSGTKWTLKATKMRR